MSARITPQSILLTDKIAVVTGAGSGIGRGIAQVFARFGAKVAIWERNEGTGEAVRDSIEAEGGEAIAQRLDVRDKDAVDRALQEVIDTFGGVDVLVNNAGGTFRQRFLDTSPNGWDTLVRSNLTHVFICTAAATRVMIEQGRGGRVINVSSIEGLRAAPNFAAYAAAKAGVINFTRTMALELAEHQITINCLAPDMTWTEGLAGLGDMPNRFEHVVPLGRAGDVEDQGAAAVYLASDFGRYVTGITLSVDGGTWASSGWARNPDNGEYILGSR